MLLKPSSLSENYNHDHGNKQHQRYRSIKPPPQMRKGNVIKVHPEDAADNGCRRKETRYHGHDLHYLIHF